LLKLTLPPKTTEVLGEEAAAEFARWITETVALRDEVVQRDEYREVLSRLDIIEHDIGRVSKRLDTIETRLDKMEERSDARFDALHARIDTLHEAMRSQTRWLVGTLIAVGGFISALITVFGFIQ